MTEKQSTGRIALAFFIIAIVMMLALFLMPIVGWDKLIEKVVSLNVNVILLVIGLVALTATILGSLAFKTIQGKVASIGGLILAVVAGGLLAVDVERGPTVASGPLDVVKQGVKEPLPDDPVSLEARAMAGKIMDRLLTGQLEEGDESGLATVAKALKGFDAWVIESQQKAEQGRSTISGRLTGPSGQAGFSVVIVKQESGKWMVGTFSGPNPVAAKEITDVK